MKKPSWISEFKEFIMRGNVLDMAVGVVIGAAFTAIVTALVDDIINPIITLISGGGKSGIEQVTVGIFPIGHLIGAVINFLIIAFVVFWMVKIINGAMNRFKKKEEEVEEEAPEPSAEEVLLTEIRDLLKEQNK
ncbi:MAG: large conductance mechanosensitive channel protein MscL [Candidatus Onthomonas sp.]|nr:large conductance mechanosensitive channel protein MscL [Candidatus Onthomonas sp.]